MKKIMVFIKAIMVKMKDLFADVDVMSSICKEIV